MTQIVENSLKQAYITLMALKFHLGAFLTARNRSGLIDKLTKNKILIFFENYSEYIFLVVFAVLFSFIYLTLKFFKAKNELYLENQRYSLLSEFSGELIFEYDLHNKTIEYIGKEKLHFDASFDPEEIRHKIIESITSELVNKEHIISIENHQGKLEYILIKQFVLMDRIDKVKAVFGSIRNVSEEIKQLEILEYQSKMDGLTNLYNYRYTKEKIEKRLASKKFEETDAFILIDLDDFKAINDLHGHLVGDEVLHNVALALDTVYSQAHVIGRYGGDEFCVYMKNVTSFNDVKDLSYKLIKALSHLVANIELTSSIGISMINKQRNFATVFSEADRAMYYGKNRGKKRVVVYQENFGRGQHER